MAMNNGNNFQNEQRVYYKIHGKFRYAIELIVLGFNDMSTLVGYFSVVSQRKRPEKGRRETEAVIEEIKERDREEKGK